MDKILKQRQVVFLGMAILFLILLVLYMFLLKPTLDAVAEQEVEIGSLEQQNETLRAKIAEFSTEDAGTGGSEAAKRAIPEGDDSKQLIVDLNQIGQRSSADLRDIQFTTVSSKEDTSGTAQSETNSQLPDGTGLIHMTGVLQGDYKQIHEWMNQLQKMPRFVSIEAFSFQQPYVQSASGSILTANVSFTAYYEGAAGSPDRSTP
ncbi:type 4a pilus biogenesis protein PilO [Paenibacillus sp. JX-17]|uniref:Type 4a pilus biogenesis protein PilO n=1 Tax=Paenibacillus lacisoli TaxID=3064525 RepID=A0ABT9CG70_9BACL|nr:type 4a pilus biogenesis protein PilO [Paenibacillus sp. JX-17]MDO7906598.1 type 4a pilus biogenesis protein PilO [Paenibacillus sp. JX-17]